MSYGRINDYYESHRSGLNRRPLDYESSALPLSYCGHGSAVTHRLRHALARTRTVTPCGTTPSRWRVYQFHHQGKTAGSPAASKCISLVAATQLLGTSWEMTRDEREAFPRERRGSNPRPLE